MDYEATGIENINPNSGLIEVNPTATRDFIHISFHDVLVPNLNYKIMNSLGVALINGVVGTGLKYELDLRNLPAGFYFIVFSSENDQSFSVTKKVIKL